VARNASNGRRAGGSKRVQTPKPTSRRAAAEPGRGGTPAQSRELRARGQRTLRKLLDAAAEVFAARGYHAARVDDVVKLARTSHGTFYLYFANKEDLFAALMAEVAAEMRALAGELGPITPDAEGQRALEAWIDRFADLYERHGATIRAWTEAEMGSQELGRLGNDLLLGLTDEVAQRIAAAVPSDEGTAAIDAEIAALVVVAMLERLNYYVLTRQVRVSRPQMVTTLATVMHAGLFGAATTQAVTGKRR
jgi:AcrR family transcriptional regulator